MGKLNVIAEPGSQNIVMSREFNAPRELVFKAYTDPALVPQWWGPAASETVVDRMDAKSGGAWHYIHGYGGEKWSFHGFYHEVTAPERIVNTYEFEGMAGHVGLITTTFTEQDGKTTVTELSVYPSVEDRDGVIASGMEGGAAESFDRFAALLETLKVTTAG